MKKDLFCGIRCRHTEKIRNLFLRSHCFNKIFLAKSKKEDMIYIYMVIIFMSFSLKNLICKNIYTMSSFMWSTLFSILKWWLYLYFIFLFSFLTYEVSYSKNIKIYRRNVEFIFAIGFQILFCGTYFCDWIVFWGSK